MKKRMIFLAILVVALSITVSLVSCEAKPSAMSSPKGDQIAVYNDAIKAGKPIFLEFYSPT
jgi:hypothetical protein